MSEILFMILFLPPIVFVILYVLINYLVKGTNSVCVVVLGDFGRSPRMQYHSLSLAREGFYVDVVGYGGSKPHKDVEENEAINQHVMREPPSFLRYLPRLLNYMVKVLWQSVVMATHLLLLPKFEHVIIQNPPTIPTLAVAWLVCLVRGSTLITDWHNYGFTILAMPLGETHLLVRFSKWFEGWFGKRSHHNICVTKAMKEDLRAAWGIQSEVLYDCPPVIFKETDTEIKHKLFKKLSGEYQLFKSSSESGEEVGTMFTVRRGESVENAPSRPALLISSTSWTGNPEGVYDQLAGSDSPYIRPSAVYFTIADEDFSILIAALDEYDTAAKESGSELPELICAITGKGPQKEHYRRILAEKTWSHVQVCLPWLEAEDYPTLLGSADVGVCLHKSSSGLDLPMKVVDMFGCNLPVCAIHFKCLHELVQHGKNGMVFKDSSELTEQLQTLLSGFPHSQTQLQTMRENLRLSATKRWHPNWKQVVLPIIRNLDREKKDS